MHGETLAEIWDSYRAILPPNASRTQVVETKRAFYAGAAAFFDLMSNAAAGSPTDEAGAAAIEAIYQEAVAFAQSVAAGEA